MGKESVAVVSAPSSHAAHTWRRMEVIAAKIDIWKSIWAPIGSAICFAESFLSSLGRAFL